MTSEQKCNYRTDADPWCRRRCYQVYTDSWPSLQLQRRHSLHINSYTRFSFEAHLFDLRKLAYASIKPELTEK